MNFDQISGSVKRLAGAIKEQWGLLTHADLTVVAGRHDQLLGRIQQLQGKVRSVSRRQLRQWRRAHDDLQIGLARPR